ncbi:phosphate ABC transporter permease PstA [Cellulomonas rhizosphaerae]|nr:phosphate ABC transporter permease PstA [Cellulomonas rhizosphaerae]
MTTMAPARTEVRRQLTGVRVSDLLNLCGAGAAAIALTALLSSQLAPITSPLGFVAVATAVFLALYALLVSLTERGVAVRDRLVTVVVHGLAFTLLAVLVFIVVFTFARGASALPHLNFFTDDMAMAGPLDPLDVGGIAHAIVGTLIQISIALAITIPLGLLTAVFLSEMPGRFARLVRTVVEAMTALPSIVAGLFVYATLILALGVPKSGLAAATAISIMMLPIMVRSSDVVLRLVPGTLKEASYALGAGQLRTVWQVVLPTTRSGLTTAVILATARGIGETSPVLLTSGFTAAMNTNPTQGPMVSLPLAIFQFVKSPEPTMVARGFGTAAVLMLLVLTLFVVARVVGGSNPLKKDARRRAREQQRRARADHRARRAKRTSRPARTDQPVPQEQS